MVPARIECKNDLVAHMKDKAAGSVLGMCVCVVCECVAWGSHESSRHSSWLILGNNDKLRESSILHSD
jgi:hypothetical protein